MKTTLNNYLCLDVRNLQRFGVLAQWVNICGATSTFLLRRFS